MLSPDACANAGLFVSAAVLPRLAVGLDQAVALPRDSYLQPYFRGALPALRVGPPMYLVVRDLDLTSPAAVNRVCSVAGCDPDSLLSRVAQVCLHARVPAV
jgi:Niemann-Pick C1 protein